MRIHIYKRDGERSRVLIVPARRARLPPVQVTVTGAPSLHEGLLAAIASVDAAEKAWRVQPAE